MIEAIEAILLKESPDWVMVYGDTDSTLAGALAAIKLHIKLAHVEAGLRSFNMRMPEEINRILTDRVSDLLLCPTDTAVSNLKNEGFDNFPARICKTGDVMFDAALFYSEFSKVPQFVKEIEGRKFVLCTIHRAENTDVKEKLEAILHGLSLISKEMQVVVPVHPRTVKKMKEFGLQLSTENIHFVDPVGYLEMIWLLQNCALVLTDSGGLQKEAYFFKKPCVTLREETEWVELVDTGFNVLAGTNADKMNEAFLKLKSVSLLNAPNLYGDGQSAAKILEELL